MLAFHFDCVPKKVKEMDFHFGNLSSRYSANNLYFTKDSRPFLPIAGELHFSRLPREMWERELLKMKDTGITVVSTYVFWNYHEPEEGVFDFSGDKDLAHFLSLCRKTGLPCVLRIGPWCHGEVVYGGFPRYVNKMPRKRCDAPRYLRCVERYWKRLAAEVKPYFDGETVLGVQLENEYGGNISHIHTLRKLAEQAGFRTPFFTMTAWPTNTPDQAFLPMFGGYPEAPWTQNRKPLVPANRFEISAAKTEAEIGGDLHEIQTGNESGFGDFPYASCELGPGNQVTQHRRPIIHENDGYGVGFTRFASGMNWIGYYMYHGGRNPNDRLMQESRITGYPNNYPIIDYDFQAPISRWGECRPHGDRLRLLHLFINRFDEQVAVKQAFFPREKRADAMDRSRPSCSVRMDESGSGYFFVSAYERGLSFPDFHDVRVQINCGEKQFSLPPVDIKAGSLFFYPFHLSVAGVDFDYVLAQPIAKVAQGEQTICYFMEIPGIAPSLSASGEVTQLPIDTVGFEKGNVQVIVLSKAKAMRFHLIGNHVVFAKGSVYTDGHAVRCEATEGYLSVDGETKEIVKKDLSSLIALEETSKVPLPYGYYLYSYGKRRYYRLKIDRKLLENRFDVKLTFSFTGLNLQVFGGKKLLHDCFNTDGEFVMCLREYRREIARYGELLIKAAPAARHGVGHVYHEIEMEPGVVSLRLLRAEEITVAEREVTM